jgi:hypothetical protein
MRLQLIAPLFAVACAPPSAGVTFAEPNSGSSSIGDSSTGAPASSSTTESASTISGDESEGSDDPMTTSGPPMGDSGEGALDGSESTTGIALPDPVTMVEWTFGTHSYAGQFAPDNIVAAWIEDGQGNFVRTLIMLSQIEKVHLVEWNLVSGGNTVDAITGATPMTHDTIHSGIWNLLDANGAIVPDGDYVLRIEMTEDNSAGVPPEGPRRSIPFTLGNGHFDLLPADGDAFHSLHVDGHD